MGYLYQPKLKSGGRSAIWWAKWYVDGRPMRESTGTEKKREAETFLKDREGGAARGEAVLPRAGKGGWEEAAADLREHYKTTGSREVGEAEGRLKHLDAFFTGYRLAGIGPAEVTRYVAKRQAEPTQMIAARDGATITRRLTSNGSINRELGVLGRLLRLAYENGKLARLPLIRKLKEAAPRSGFFEREQYEAVRRHLAPDLQAACAIAYTFGWRMRSEVLLLERRHLDLGAGTLRLDPGMTKNGDARVRHDFRRTAVRNMERHGVPRSVATKLTGHKTEAVFRRYAIVSDADLREAALRLTDTSRGHVSGTSRVVAVDGRALRG